MTLDRITLCAVAAALAVSLTGEAYGQPAASGAGVAAPAPARAGATALNPGTGATEAARSRTDSARTQTQAPAATQQAPGPASTQPSSAKGLASGAAAAGTTQPTPDAATGSGITGGVPSLTGVTPGRAELPASAFKKLDAADRGYVTLEDVRRLDGFESAFRQADQNGDGRLNASEFNSAWGVFTGNVR